MPYSCVEHLSNLITKALTCSNVDQAKVRILDLEIEIHHCDVCDKVAHYHIVPIKFR